MNKTVNINLANMFFHIDEDAYNNLQRYLNAIKRSFTDSQGRDEIIADIEARVAELFAERIKNERQVISNKEVDEVIAVMGQPEDYLVDEEIFEDRPKSSYTKTGSYRKLYRDYDNKFLGGVCAGLAKYFGIDSLWIRLIAIIVVLAGIGSPILVYIILWVLIPKAQTTSEKLAMAGKPANITNIERKIKEGLDDVQEKLSDVNFESVGSKAKSGSSSFFESIGDILMVFLKIFAKFFGVIFIIVAASTLISIIVGAIGISLFDYNIFSGEEWLRYQDLGILNDFPHWILGLLFLFAFGIPALAIFILGIRMLVKNSKSIGMTAKIALFILWIASWIGIAFIASNVAINRNIEASVSERTELPVKANDTIRIKMVGNDDYDYGLYRDLHDYEVTYDENDEQVLYSSAVRLMVRAADSENAMVKVVKKAGGSSYDAAKDRARGIDYNYAFENNTLKLDGYFLFNPEDKHNQQEVEIILRLPEGTILYADRNTRSYHLNNRRYFKDILDSGQERHYLQVIDGDLKCLDCPSKKKDETKQVTKTKTVEKSADSTKTVIVKKKDSTDLTSIKTDTIRKN